MHQAMEGLAGASPKRTEVRPTAVAPVYDRRGDRSDLSIGRNTFRVEQDASTVVKDSSTKHIQ